jgi:hypothetical protein
MPFLPDVHIDQALTNVSVAYTQAMLVGDKVLPPVPVDKRSDLWFIYGKEYFKLRDDLVRPGATAGEIFYTVTKGNFNAERHAQRKLVTDAEVRYQDSPLNAAIDTTEFATASVQNSRENRQLALVTSATQITQNTGLSGTSQWSDYTNSTPLTNIRTAKTSIRNSIVKEANYMTLLYDCAMVLADHPSIKDLIKYTDANNVSTSGLPNVVRGLMVNVSGAVDDTVDEGQTASFSSMFGKNVLIHYTTANVGLKSLSLGYTFEAPDDTTGVRGYAVQRYRDEAKHGEYVEVGTTYDVQLIAPLAGYLFTTAVA